MEQQADSQDLTMRDYLKVLFRQKLVILITIVTVCVATYFGLKLKTPVYEASVKMLITAEKQVESPYYRDIMYSGRNIEQALTQSEVVKANPVIERAIAALGLMNRPLDYEKNFASPLRIKVLEQQLKQWKLDQYSEEQKKAIIYRLTIDDLKEHVKVEPIRDTNMFTISVRDYSPVGAAIIANTISRSYVMFDLEQQLVETQNKYGIQNPLVIQLKDSIDKMGKSLNGQPLSALDAIGPASVKIIEQSQPPLKPVGLPKMVLGALALVMSLFLAVMLAFMFDYLDPSFKSPYEAERFLGIPVLGFVPDRRMFEKTLVRDSKRSGPYVKYNENLADQFYVLKKSKGAKAVILTSTSLHEGATTVAANLAYCLGHKSKQKALLIDANLRHPSIHTLYKMPIENGLTELLEGKITLDKAVRKVDEHLSVIPAGVVTVNPITLIDSPAMAELLDKLKDKYDAILIDCANLQTYRDAAALLPSADGLIVVIKEGETRRQAVQSALGNFDKRKVLGFVLNHRSFPIPKWIYDTV